MFWGRGGPLDTTWSRAWEGTERPFSENHLDIKGSLWVFSIHGGWAGLEHVISCGLFVCSRSPSSESGAAVRDFVRRIWDESVGLNRGKNL